jgi:hypothetical protein
MIADGCRKILDKRPLLFRTAIFSFTLTDGVRTKLLFIRQIFAQHLHLGVYLTKCRLTPCRLVLPNEMSFNTPLK